MKRFLLLTVIAASFVIPYLVGSSLVFGEMAIIHFATPTGPVKTLLVLTFFGFIAVMLPVLPLLFLNLIPVGLAFMALRIIKENEQSIFWVFVFYHVIFLVTIYYTIKAGRALILEMDAETVNKIKSE